MPGFLIRLSRTLLILTLIVTVLALLVAGVVLGFAWIGDAPLQVMNSAMENLGVGTLNDLRLPSLWGHLAVPVYTCAALALLSLVSLFIIRKPKPSRHTHVEGTA